MPIPLGQYEAQLNEVEKILRRIQLLDGWRNDWHKPIGLAAQLRGRSYRQVWECLYARQYFDFRLRDYALLQFRREEGEQLSYAYYDAPFDFLTYEEFIEREMGLRVADVGDEFQEEYEQFLQDQPRRDTVTPIRYDYTPDDYRAGRHPASHLHFGNANQIRVGTERIFLPLSFTLFVVRQCYPDEWGMLLDCHEAPAWCRNIRENIAEVPGEYSQARDAFEHALR